MVVPYQLSQLKELAQPATQISDPVDTKTPQQSQQEKLKQVKDLYDKGLITKEIYVERQRKILEGS